MKKLPDNEHVWYNVDNVQAIAFAITRVLEKLHPQSRVGEKQPGFPGIPGTHPGENGPDLRAVQGHARGLTETIFLYQAVPLGLNVLTPFEFQKAIAEGNDPPADTVVETENQITQKKIRILIYNEQTVSPITTKAQNDAKASGVPIVGVTETMPAGETYQTWMLRQLDELRMALISAGS